MPKDSLRAGLAHSETILITDRLIVPEMADFFADFAAMPPVFATAYLVAFVEWTCVRALSGHLLAGEHTVGTRVDLSHTAATPAGMRATASVELIELSGRKLRFRIACRDEQDEIGAGFHERYVIDQARFLAKLAEKRAARSQAQSPGAAGSEVSEALAEELLDVSLDATPVAPFSSLSLRP